MVRLCAGSSLDCVSEEVRGALPSLISLMVSVDVKPYVLLHNNSDSLRRSLSVFFPSLFFVDGKSP